MVKHASSHALSVFMCTIISAILVELIKPLLPELFAKFESYTQQILSYVPIPVDPKYFNILLIATILGIIWGIFFKLRFDKD
jgi:hypothetical protein